MTEKSDVQTVVKPEAPTLRGILLWCGAANPDDEFMQQGLAKMLERYSVSPQSAQERFNKWLEEFDSRQSYVDHSNPEWGPDVNRNRAWEAFKAGTSVSASPASLRPACPNCSGTLSYTHNRVLSFFSCNGRCKGTFELHSAQDMVKFFKPAPAQCTCGFLRGSSSVGLKPCPIHSPQKGKP